MKKSLFILTLLVSGFVKSQNVTIPDPAFKAFLVAHPVINVNEDTEIQLSEATAYSDSIIAVGLGIQDLTGIEAFTNITFLSVVNNSLNSINVTQNTQLKGLICAMNNLSTINVTQNTQLERLVVAYNSGFMGFDLSNNIHLKELNIDNTSVFNLDLANQVELEKLYCSEASLMSLNVSTCPVIKSIECMSNQLLTLNLTGCTQLETLSCQGNMLSTIDLSTNIGMKTLKVCCNQMTSLDVSNLINLEILDAPFNNYPSIDLTHNPNLQKVYLFDSQINSLNIANGNNENLQLVWAQNNPYTCVTVDSVEYSISNWDSTSTSFLFTIDAVFSEDCSTLNVQENKLSSIDVYPNPFTDVLTMTLRNKANLIIYSTKGELIFERVMDEGNNTLNLSELKEGIYFLQLIENGNRIEQKKLIKI